MGVINDAGYRIGLEGDGNSGEGTVKNKSDGGYKELGYALDIT